MKRKKPEPPVPPIVCGKCGYQGAGVFPELESGAVLCFRCLRGA